MRAKAPLHELLNRQQARQALFAQVLNALVHQLKVGLAGRKARMGGGIFALHLPRQPRQVIQQRRLGIAIRLADGIGQLSQFFSAAPSTLAALRAAGRPSKAAMR